MADPLSPNPGGSSRKRMMMFLWIGFASFFLIIGALLLYIYSTSDIEKHGRRAEATKTDDVEEKRLAERDARYILQKEDARVGGNVVSTKIYLARKDFRKKDAVSAAIAREAWDLATTYGEARLIEIRLHVSPPELAKSLKRSDGYIGKFGFKGETLKKMRLMKSAARCAARYKRRIRDRISSWQISYGIG